MSVVDADRIRMLARVLREFDLTALEYKTETCTVKVERTFNFSVEPLSAPSVKTSFSEFETKETKGSEQGAKTFHAAQAPSDERTDEKTWTSIASPMVGTAYLSPQPGSSPYIQVGDTIKPGQILLILEAMKVMNPVRATQTGTVKKICVQDGSPVEFGADLVKIVL